MSRKNICTFQEIPNVGKSTERDFILLGLTEPFELVGRDPYKMYDDLCEIYQKRLDPCVIDVFISAVWFMEGGEVRKWWQFTKQRKQHLSKM